MCKDKGLNGDLTACRLAENGNLDRKNPHAAPDFAHLPPEQLAADLLQKERRIAAILEEIQQVLTEAGR
ncbi:MAG TPA: hypothetical protein VKY74_07500 [Chloroflexia bacterium]|nr:hypothetical protein [Chloroflexia bacterium]